MAEMKVLSDIKKLDDKIGVLTELSTTEKGNLVGAVNENTEQINVLNDYKYHPTITTPNNLPSGKWYMRSPDNPTDDFYYIDCGISPASGYMYQRARYVFWNQSYDRVQIGGVWKAWQPIATTTKTSFLCTAVSGYTITSQNCYMMNGVPYVKISIVKTDGGSFNVGNHISVATLPFSSSNTPLSFAGASGGYWSSIGSAMVSGTSLVATINTSNTTQIVISGVIV